MTNICHSICIIIKYPNILKLFLKFIASVQQVLPEQLVGTQQQLVLKICV